jgi:SOS-response transcriptional repressor LexA
MSKKAVTKVTLTRNQAETVEFVRAFLKEHGHPPSLAKIAENFGIGQQAAFYRVESLRRRGVLHRPLFGRIELVPETEGGRA